MRGNNEEIIKQYYLQQSGSGIGPLYHGSEYQIGGGIGSILSGVFRRIYPLFTASAKTIGREALQAGVKSIKDAVFHQQDLKKSLKRNFGQAGQNLLSTAKDKLKELSGSGYNKRKRKRKVQSLVNSKRNRLVVARRDIFA